MEAIAVIVGACLIGLLLCLLGLLQNDRVHSYRGRLLDRISILGDADIKAGRDWLWRYEAYRSVSYDQMLLQFWKPLSSWHKGEDFNVE